MKQRITVAQEAELSGTALTRYANWKASLGLVAPPDFVQLLELFVRHPAAWMGDNMSLDPRAPVLATLNNLLDNWETATADMAAFRLRVTRLAARLAEPNERHITVLPAARTSDGQVRFAMTWDGRAEPIDALWEIAKGALRR